MLFVFFSQSASNLFRTVAMVFIVLFLIVASPVFIVSFTFLCSGASQLFVGLSLFANVHLVLPLSLFLSLQYIFNFSR